MKYSPSFLMILNLIQFFFAAYECHVISGREVDETVKMTESKLPPKIDLSQQEDSEGDIQLPRKSPIDGNERSAVLNDFRWPYGTIPFVISDKYNEAAVERIKDAMNAISSRTCIKFVARKKQEGYIFLTKDGTRTCQSKVGYNGEMIEVLLNDNCIWDRNGRSLKHELMHAIGFYHEHSRTDRDEYVTIDWNNIKENQEHNFKKYSSSEVQLLGTPYDLKSIMQYEYQFAIDISKRTVTGKESYKVKTSDDFTLTDVLDMNLLYNCSDIIRWKEHSLDIGTFAWIEDYEFNIGENIYKGKTRKSADCGRLCVANVRCTHFNWYSNGVCILKKYHIKKYPKATPLEGAICGFVQEGNSAAFEWYVSEDDKEIWSYGCDFPGNNIKCQDLKEDNCSSRCFNNTTCTNYFVTKSEISDDMKYCCLKTGRNPIASFFSNDKADYCSLIRARVLNGN